jgi:hypothetical protein
MTQYEKMKKARAEFKAKVLALLTSPNLLSYEEIGAQMGISRCRVYQYRKEFGLPRRTGGYHNTPKAGEAK